MSHILADFKTFLDQSPTSWHAVREIGNRLAICEYSPLNEGEPWKLEQGKKYFVARGGALCAFSIPLKKPERALILASHTDSPGLKLKPLPTFHKDNMVQFGVEPYGAPLLTSWINRDLVLAGRVIITDTNGDVTERLVHLDDAILFIPQLAVHLDRDVNEKGFLLNKQEHLSPIVGLTDVQGNALSALEHILKRYISFQTLLSFELFLVPQEKANFSGYQSEMINSYRLDNLASAHASLSALSTITKPSANALHMAVFWDHEEIGSRSSEGASCPFLSDTLMRINHSLHHNLEDLFLLKRHSFCVSIDMTHGVNPNYPQKSEPQHRPLLGKGVVIKYNADQKYATNALSSAVITKACQMLNLPVQSYVSRSDIPSGSTVGPIMATQLGINTVDIGCPQLSMHSIRETMACQDYLDLYRLLSYLVQEA